MLLKGGESRMSEWKKAIQAMINWIDENIDKNPTLLDMSKQIGYSPYYCSSQFHQIVGMAIREYVSQQKLYYAALDIRDTDKRIIDVAIQYGYSSHEALTTAFRKKYGISPKTYRRENTLIHLPLKQSVLPPEQYQKGEIFMITNASVRVEYIPAHKYVGVYKQSTTKNGEIWAGHDCDLVTSTVHSMGSLSDPIVTAHTAGWVWSGKNRTYFYGLGVPLDFKGKIPEGFEMRDIPGSYYIVFSHPPFDYPKDNEEAINVVEKMAWNFDPKTMGLVWNEIECQDYQRHYPEGLGYQVLRPVKKA